jgi:acyl transferase domain-containing protein
MTSAVQITPSSVFLVSGGAKGITAKCVTRLVQHQSCKLILLGRSPILEVEPDWAKDCFDESQLKKHIMEDLLSKGEKPIPMAIQKVFRSLTSSREIRDNLQAIEQAGGKAEYIDVDITDVSALRLKLEAIVERVGAVTGIIHGAGNLSDKLVERKTEQDFETVYAAKVKGLENLLSCIPASQLDYLVLFSSVSGFYGNIGQTDYAMANEILNKSAHLVKQHYPSCHVVAINWGAWDSGMVTPELKKAFAQRNIEIIPIEVGAQMMVNEMNIANRETAQVVIGSPVFPPVRELNPDLKTYCIRRKLTLEANPFLQDHVIAGNPVLPATCAISWIIGTCEQLYPTYEFFSCTDFRIFKGIIFDQTLASEYSLDIQEITKDSSEIEFEAKIWSRNKTGKIHYHYASQVKLLRKIPSAPTNELFNLTQDHVIADSGASFYKNGETTLFHGPAFQTLENVLNITPEKITTQSTWQGIGEKQQGQFPLQTINPYVIDLQTHGVWIWLRHFYMETCLPTLLQKFEHFADIPCGETFYVTAEIKSKTASTVITDITSHDLHGKIYSRFLGAKATIFSLEMARRRGNPN